MRAFVVQYRPNPEAEFKVSQEAFSSLEEAQQFVEGRAYEPIKYSEYCYRTRLFDEYRITEVLIFEKKDDGGYMPRM